MGNGTSDEEVMSIIAKHRSPAIGASKIADTVDVSRQSIDRRLRNLQEDGLVERYKAGRDVVWYLTDAGKRYLEK